MADKSPLSHSREELTIGGPMESTREPVARELTSMSLKELRERAALTSQLLAIIKELQALSKIAFAILS